jgi:hypothetical protein
MGKQGRARNAIVAGRVLDRDGRIPQGERERGEGGGGGKARGVEGSTSLQSSSQRAVRKTSEGSGEEVRES